jgi:hypothetical protein
MTAMCNPFGHTFLALPLSELVDAIRLYPKLADKTPRMPKPIWN